MIRVNELIAIKR